MARLQWSHSDGTALCPVPSPSGGYRPAQPVPDTEQWGAELDPDVSRLDPTPSMHHHWRAPSAPCEPEVG
jgi:hypothetical protein